MGFLGGVLAVLGGATPGLGEEVTCRGVLGRMTVDNLRVADGTRCTLRGTRVQGSIVVESGATLVAIRSSVVGNVQAENAKSVSLVAARVGGSVQLKQGGGASVKDTRIAGDLQLDANRRPLKALRNTIGGSLQAFQNSGGLLVKGNAIDGNLQCKENVPPPNGGGNTVRGTAEDQCASLARASGRPDGGGGGGDGGGGTPPPPADPGCQYGAVTLGDDFEIPAGVHCTLRGTRVAGSIKLNRGSSLDAVAVLVDGNVQAQEAASVAMAGSRVAGSVQIDASGNAIVQETAVEGSVQLVGNGGVLLVTDSRIGADLQAFQNRGGPGITFARNHVGGNLQCKENAPRPGGGGNRVEGNKEDQCAGL